MTDTKPVGEKIAFDQFGTLEGVLKGQPFKIFPQGTYYRGERKLDITPERLREFAANVKAGRPQFRIPINLNHNHDSGKVGSVDDVDYLPDGEDGPGLYATKYDLSPRGQQAVKDDGYDQVSGEAVWSLMDGAKFQDIRDGKHYDNCLVGVALTPTGFFGKDVALFSANPSESFHGNHDQKSHGGGGGGGDDSEGGTYSEQYSRNKAAYADKPTKELQSIVKGSDAAREAARQTYRDETQGVRDSAELRAASERSQVRTTAIQASRDAAVDVLTSRGDKIPGMRQTARGYVMAGHSDETEADEMTDAPAPKRGNGYTAVRGKIKSFIAELEQYLKDEDGDGVPDAEQTEGMRADVYHGSHDQQSHGHGGGGANESSADIKRGKDGKPILSKEQKQTIAEMNPVSPSEYNSMGQNVPSSYDVNQNGVNGWYDKTDGRQVSQQGATGIVARDSSGNFYAKTTGGTVIPVINFVPSKVKFSDETNTDHMNSAVIPVAGIADTPAAEAASQGVETMAEDKPTPPAPEQMTQAITAEQFAAVQAELAVQKQAAEKFAAELKQVARARRLDQLTLRVDSFTAIGAEKAELAAKLMDLEEQAPALFGYFDGLLAQLDGALATGGLFNAQASGRQPKEDRGAETFDAKVEAVWAEKYEKDPAKYEAAANEVAKAHPGLYQASRGR